ncbi:MAG: hypothetical protein KDA66_00415 [Planctomycetaceae bacterium]|nr:hypothetical protein [Planctomycetaceae bacterium]
MTIQETPYVLPDTPRTVRPKSRASGLKQVWTTLLLLGPALACLVAAGVDTMVLGFGEAAPGVVTHVDPARQPWISRKVTYEFMVGNEFVQDDADLTAHMAQDVQQGMTVDVLYHPSLPVWTNSPNWPHRGLSRWATVLFIVLIGALLAWLWSHGVGRYLRARWLLINGAVARGLVLRRAPIGKEVQIQYVFRVNQGIIPRIVAGQTQVPAEQCDEESVHVTVLYDPEHPSRSTIYESAAWDVIDAGQNAMFEPEDRVIDMPDAPVQVSDATLENEVVAEVNAEDYGTYGRDFARFGLNSQGLRTCGAFLFIGGPAVLLLLTFSMFMAIVVAAVAFLLTFMLGRTASKQFLSGPFAIGLSQNFIQVRTPVGSSRVRWDQIHEVEIKENSLVLWLYKRQLPILITERMFPSPEEFDQFCEQVDDLRKSARPDAELPQMESPRESVHATVDGKRMLQWFRQYAQYDRQAYWPALLVIGICAVMPWVLVIGFWEPHGLGLFCALTLTLLSQYLLLMLLPQLFVYYFGNTIGKLEEYDVHLLAGGVRTTSYRGDGFYPWRAISSVADEGGMLAMRIGDPASLILVIPDESFGSTELRDRFTRQISSLWTQMKN